MDETTVRDRLRSYIEDDDHQIRIVGTDLVARGRRARARRRTAMGAAVVAAAVGLAAIGLPVLTEGKVSLDPAGLIRVQGEKPLDQRIDELIRANVPHGGEFELVRIKAFRWDELHPLPANRWDEATRWTARYLLHSDTVYEQEISVELKYLPPKQWPARYEGWVPYEPEDGVDRSGSVVHGTVSSSDIRQKPEAGPPFEPGFVVTVQESTDTTYHKLPRPVDLFDMEELATSPADPDLKFAPPATWPPDVKAPQPN